MLSGAVRRLRKGGSDKLEILRLRSVIAGCKVYKELLADYIDYRGLEAELVNLREKYEMLSKKSQGI